MSKQNQTKKRDNKSSNSKNTAYKIFLATVAIIIILAMVLSMFQF